MNDAVRCSIGGEEGIKSAGDSHGRDEEAPAELAGLCLGNERIGWERVAGSGFGRFATTGYGQEEQNGSAEVESRPGGVGHVVMFRRGRIRAQCHARGPDRWG